MSNIGFNDSRIFLASLILPFPCLIAVLIKDNFQMSSLQINSFDPFLTDTKKHTG